MCICVNSGSNGPFSLTCSLARETNFEILRGKDIYIKCRAISTSGIVRRVVEIAILRRRKHSSVCFRTRFNARDSIV